MTDPIQVTRSRASAKVARRGKARYYLLRTLAVSPLAQREVLGARNLCLVLLFVVLAPSSAPDLGPSASWRGARDMNNNNDLVTKDLIPEG